jgi:uncharacterized protein YciI
VFVIELICNADLSQIDAQMKPHMAYLQKHYDAGKFIASGRKVPRDGGIILAVGDALDQIEAIVREDPFVVRGLADYRIVEFRKPAHKGPSGAQGGSITFSTFETTKAWTVRARRTARSTSVRSRPSSRRSTRRATFDRFSKLFSRPGCDSGAESATTAPG